MINDCNKTNLILKYEPELLSIAAIHLSAKMNNIKLVCFLIITCQFELICFFNRKIYQEWDGMEESYEQWYDKFIDGMDEAYLKSTQFFI